MSNNILLMRCTTKKESGLETRTQISEKQLE